MVYDLIIIGAGPAGLSAALTACYLKLKHLVIEARKAGGILASNYPWKEVDSYLGFFEMSGQGVAKKIVDHVRRENANIIENEIVMEIRKNKNGKIEVKTKKGRYLTKTVLIAIGTFGSPRRLGVQGEENPNVNYSIPDPKEHKGKKVLVVGGGDSALEGAGILKKNGAEVFLIHRKDMFRAMEKNQEEVKRRGVKIMYNTELKRVSGKDKIEKVKLENNKTREKTSLKVDEVFIFIGSEFDVGFLKKAGLKIEGNHLVADSEMRTNVEGIFAAGDITGRLKRIPEAVGEGHLAVYSIYKYLKKPYWA